MRFSVKKYKAALVIVVFGSAILFASQCMSPDPSAPADIRGAAYAGSEACQSCHASLFNSFLHTAHARASLPPTAQNIKGSFKEGENAFSFSDEVQVQMEKREDGFYQTLYTNGRPSLSHRFDLVMGAGRKAQTFLYFDSSQYYQLPVSYFVSEKSWANSPIFPSTHPKFDRIIPSGCFACHSSAVGVTETYKGFQKVEVFQKEKIIYGIDCERCHGPAAEHIAYQQLHPEEKIGKHISSLRSLSRVQKTDLCALCHAGVKDMQRSPFSFRPGDSLSQFFYPEFSLPDPEKLDVHGNQYGLMKGSPCYQQTLTLTCNSCHDPHTKEGENMAIFSQRCISCHTQATHSFVDDGRLSAAQTSTNCIDCHMPLKASTFITMLTRQNTEAKPDSIRTHLIKIYPEETKRFLQERRVEKGVKR